MFKSTSGVVTSNQRNILVLGSTGVGKTPFIKYFEAFCKYNEVTHSLHHFQELESPFQSTEEITNNYVKALGEQLCFIDTPGSCTIQTINNIKIHIANFNCIDVIIIILNEDLDYLKFYITNIISELNNFPSENIIFITLHDEDSNLNELVTLVNLRKILKESSSKITVSLNKNLYLLELNNFFNSSLWNNRSNEHTCLQESANFCRNFGAYMKILFGTQQFVIRFFTTKDSLKTVIETLFILLIDMLHCVEDNLQTLQAHARDYNYNSTTVKYLHSHGTSVYIICKNCSTKEYPVICHDNCDCVDPSQTKEIHSCTVFKQDTDTCRECGCKIEYHTNTRYYAFTKQLKGHGLEKKFAFEKNTIIYLLATLHAFCQKNFNGLPKACRNFKELWSPGKLSDINTEDPVYKELEENIKQSTNCPTLEEMAVYIRDFTVQKFHCVHLHLDLIEKFLQPEFKLKMNIIFNREDEHQAGPSKPPENNVPPRRFPEMSSGNPPNVPNKPKKKETLEESVAMLKILQELRNAMAQMKESIEKLQSDQSNLKIQIDQINSKLGL